MQQIHLGAIDYTILIVYFAFVLGIGVVLRRSVKSSEDFSANLGTQEVIGMGASGAKYGMMTSHFYTFAVMTVFSSGISMYALAKLRGVRHDAVQQQRP